MNNFYPWLYRGPWRCEYCRQYNSSWGRDLTCEFCGGPHAWESYEVTLSDGHIWTGWQEITPCYPGMTPNGKLR